MPVYNCERFLTASIDSVLTQTLTGFEFIIINDGSTDTSEDIINSYQDPRIRYIKNSQNRGIVATLNHGLKMSRGKYVARMDADDIASPDRLSKQLAYMENNPNCKLCGSQAYGLNSGGKRLYQLNRPLKHDQIKVFNFFRNAFIHPAIIADAETIKGYAYQETYKYAEDYFLFSQITMHHKVANLKQRCLNYRIHGESITISKTSEMISSEVKTVKYLLSFLFDEVSERMLLLHHSILRPENTSFSLSEMENYLFSISVANMKSQIFDQYFLDKQLQKEWYNILLRSGDKKSVMTYLSSRLFRIKHFNFKQLFKLMLIK